MFTTVYHYVFFHQWPLDSDHIEHVAEFAEHQIQRYVLLPFNKRWATYQACGSAFISSERIHHFRLNTDYRPGSRAFITKNLKNVAGRKFWSKTTIYLSLGLQQKERPSYRRSLQFPKRVIQHFKTWLILIHFFRLLCKVAKGKQSFKLQNSFEFEHNIFIYFWRYLNFACYFKSLSTSCKNTFCYYY